jgi:uncharacterized cupin superfamily protein
MSQSRVLASDVRVNPLTEVIPAGVEIVADQPTAAVLELDSVGGVDVGIWEMTSGTARDVEADEIFVVLSGAGVLSLADGTTVTLQPGLAVHLAAGEHTEWTITETLRKVYITPSD